MFVKRKPAFDVVVDGLNVANISKDKSKMSVTVRIYTDSHGCKIWYKNEMRSIKLITS